MAPSAPIKSVETVGKSCDFQMTKDLTETAEIEEDEDDENIQEESAALEGESKANFQTQAARANYLCLDRPDIAFATEECM